MTSVQSGRVCECSVPPAAHCPMRQHTSTVNARAALLPNLVALADGRAADAIEHCGPRGLASPTALPYVHAHPPSGPATIARAVQSDPAALGRSPCARQLVLVATSTARAACIDLAAPCSPEEPALAVTVPRPLARSARRSSLLVARGCAGRARRVFAVCLHVLAGHTHTFARTAICSPYDCDRPKDEDRHGRRELSRDRQLDSESNRPHSKLITMDPPKNSQLALVVTETLSLQSSCSQTSGNRVCVCEQIPPPVPPQATAYPSKRSPSGNQ